MFEEDARQRIHALEEKGGQRDREIAELSTPLSRAALDTERLAPIVDAVRAEVSGSKAVLIAAPAFRHSSLSSVRSGFACCGAAGATASLQKTFTAAVMATPTLCCS
jgi:hypothetical protein